MMVSASHGIPKATGMRWSAVTDAGERYVNALATKDTEALRELFAADVLFRGMTPGRFWEVRTPDDVIHQVLYQWFEPSDVIEGVEQVVVGEIVGRERVDYRFRVRNDDGLFTVEQRAYIEVNVDGRICRMDAMCSGYRPIAQAAAADR
jgi:hypothetical protein